MTKPYVGVNRTRKILERREMELAQGMRRRDGIAVEKSADQMDEIQYASERELAIRMVDRDSDLLRNVRAALGRLQDGSYGICIECEDAISPHRLAIMPWASRCVYCQESADRQGSESQDFVGMPLVSAAGVLLTR